MRETTTLLIAVALVASRAPAQVPGLPVFQGAFPAPGLAVGANAGRGSGRTLVAGAVGYGPASGRFALVAGIGAFSETEPGFRKGRLAYGARVAFTAVRFADQRIALTPFAGFGSARATLVDPVRSGLPATVSDTGAAIQSDEIPLGVSAGWRAGLGGARAIGLSIAPTYALYRRTGGATGDHRGALRVATVAEVTVTQRLGVTFGAEFGQAAGAGEPGPKGARYGVGASFGVARR